MMRCHSESPGAIQTLSVPLSSSKWTGTPLSKRPSPPIFTSRTLRSPCMGFLPEPLPNLVRWVAKGATGALFSGDIRVYHLLRYIFFYASCISLYLSRNFKKACAWVSRFCVTPKRGANLLNFRKRASQIAHSVP